VQRLVDLGPRTPQSEAIEKSRAYIKQGTELFGLARDGTAVHRRDFRWSGSFRKSDRAFWHHWETTDLFLLCSHYDTKSSTHFGSWRERWRLEHWLASGISEGVSSTAAPGRKIELVSSTARKLSKNFSNTDGIYGSRHFAHELGQDGSAKSFRGGILFDMVGDRSLDITFPQIRPQRSRATFLLRLTR